MSKTTRGRNKSKSVGNCPSGCNSQTLPFCKTHQQRILCLFCSFCEKPVCEKCKKTTHARHATDVKGTESLIQAAKYRRRFLYKHVERKQVNVVKRMKVLMLHIVESKAKLKGKVDDCIRRYKNYANIHRDKLTVSEEEWTYDVMFRTRQFCDVLDEKMEFLNVLLSDTVNTLDVIEKKLKTSSDPDLLLIFGTLRTTLEQIQPPKWPREEISVRLKLELIPVFGSSLVPQQGQLADRNCTIDFLHEVTEPTVYKRVFDTKLPIPKRVFDDEFAKVSMTSSTDMFISFGEYIVVLPLDNRRSERVSRNVKFKKIITTGENVLDISSGCPDGNLYFIVSSALKVVLEDKKIKKCFSLNETPNAICVSRTNPLEIYVGFHDAGKVCKFTLQGVLVLEMIHPDPRLIYRPRHIATNFIGDIFFSDDISNVTILDSNGIWKGIINRDVKTTSSYGPLRPTGIATSFQRHVFIIDGNSVTNLHVFTEDGNYLQTIAIKNIQDAYIVNVDRTGDVWVAFKDGGIRMYRPVFIEDKLP